MSDVNTFVGPLVSSPFKHPWVALEGCYVPEHLGHLVPRREKWPSTKKAALRFDPIRLLSSLAVFMLLRDLVLPSYRAEGLTPQTGSLCHSKEGVTDILPVRSSQSLVGIVTEAGNLLRHIGAERAYPPRTLYASPTEAR